MRSDQQRDDRRGDPQAFHADVALTTAALPRPARITARARARRRWIQFALPLRVIHVSASSIVMATSSQAPMSSTPPIGVTNSERGGAGEHQVMPPLKKTMPPISASAMLCNVADGSSCISRPISSRPSALKSW